MLFEQFYVIMLYNDLRLKLLCHKRNALLLLLHIFLIGMIPHWIVSRTSLTEISALSPILSNVKFDVNSLGIRKLR